MLGFTDYLWHLIRKGHWLKPRIVSHDRYGFDIVDGCERCIYDK